MGLLSTLFGWIKRMVGGKKKESFEAIERQERQSFSQLESAKAPATELAAEQELEQETEREIRALSQEMGAHQKAAEGTKRLEEARAAEYPQGGIPLRQRSAQQAETQALKSMEEKEASEVKFDAELLAMEQEKMGILRQLKNIEQRLFAVTDLLNNPSTTETYRKELETEREGLVRVKNQLKQKIKILESQIEAKRAQMQAA